MKKLISLCLIFIICFSFILQIGATEISNPENIEVPIVANVKAAKLSFTVPTNLPINVDEYGNVTTANDIKIINNSAGPIKIENVQVESQNGWELIAFDTDKSSFKIDEKKIGLQINSTNETTKADGSFAFDNTKWTILSGNGNTDNLDEYMIYYNAVVSPQSSDVTNAIAANVIFTVGWEQVEIEYTPFTVTSSNRKMIGYTGVANEELVIPETFVGDDGVNYKVVGIEYRAFNERANLTSVTIPDSVIEIGGMAFYYCDNLTSVNIPNSVAFIGAEAFAYCSLTSVTIPNSVTSINEATFIGCSSLTSVTISDSVTIIDNLVFQGCYNLTDVYYTGTEEQWSAIIIESYGNEYLTNATIHYNYTPA